MDQASLVLRSIEIASKKEEDLTPLVYPIFFEKYPETEIEFGNDADDSAKGRMLVNLVMEIIGQAENKTYPGNIRRWMTDHLEYGVNPQMYVHLLDCLRNVVKTLNGSEWNDEVNAAWQAQFDKLLVFVDEAYTKTHG